MRTLYVSTMVGTALLAILFAVTAKTPIEKVKDSVVKVITPFGRGSGVVISKSGSKYLVVTAAHVVKDFLYVFVKKGHDSCRGKIISVVKNNDLALINVTCGFENTYAADTREYVELGEELLIYGYPGGVKYPIITNGVASTGTIDVKRGPAKWHKDFKAFYTTATIGKGMSGGGCFSKKGKLLGIVSYTKPLRGYATVLGTCMSIGALFQL